MAGAEPTFLDSGWDPDWQLPTWPTAELVSRRLKANPNARAVLLTRPDYFGQAVDLKAIRAVCGDRPLLVDEAHGAHLGLAPSLPRPALSLEADGVVQSTHKLSTALTQASMLHVRGSRLDPVRVRRALRLLQTTSPSYLLLASLDAARAQRETMAPRWSPILEALDRARRTLEHHGIPCLGPTHGPRGDWDPAKLILDLNEKGLSGLDLAQSLHDEHLIQVELATPRYLGLIVTPSHTESHLSRFVQAVLQSLLAGKGTKPNLPSLPPLPQRAMPSREAFLGPSRSIPIERALGEVAAEFVSPYPPGLPALLPGERIDRETLSYLRDLKQLGASFVGPEDPSLGTLQVCAPIHS